MGRESERERDGEGKGRERTWGPGDSDLCYSALSLCVSYVSFCGAGSQGFPDQTEKNKKPSSLPPSISYLLSLLESKLPLPLFPYGLLVLFNVVVLPYIHLYTL